VCSFRTIEGEKLLSRLFLKSVTLTGRRVVISTEDYRPASVEAHQVHLIGVVSPEHWLIGVSGINART
jgi:hypothetical protein